MADGADRLWVEEMPAAYERWLAPTVFRPFALDLAGRVAARAPRRLLELAAGTGVLTRELVAALGTGAVVATDLNDAMVRVGREQAPQATWRQADAMSLPFGDAAFDLVACQFGVMFFPDKTAAFAEVRRVLGPGGTFAFTTWASLATHEFEVAVQGALARLFPTDPPTFLATVPHGYADPDAVVADLRAAGLQPTTVESVTVTGRADSAADLAAGYCRGTPLRAALEARVDLDDFVPVFAHELEARLGTGPVTGRMSAYVVEAEPVAG